MARLRLVTVGGEESEDTYQYLITSSNAKKRGGGVDSRSQGVAEEEGIR